MPNRKVILDLHLQVAPHRVPELKAFLRRAIPYYLQPGGIRIRLLQDRADPTLWIERVEYSDAAVYERDQQRLAEDEQMKSLLAEWRALLNGPPTVRVYQEVTLDSDSSLYSEEQF